jgi:hypothetical protein
VRIRPDRIFGNHKTLKNRILLENYYLPGDLEAQIQAFVDDYESIGNLTRPTSTSDAAKQSCCREKGSNARPSPCVACSINGKPRNIINETSQSLP